MSLPTIGTRVRNRRTDETGVVVEATAACFLHAGDVAVRYDDDPRVAWAVPASRLEQMETVS